MLLDDKGTCDMPCIVKGLVYAMSWQETLVLTRHTIYNIILTVETSPLLPKVPYVVYMQTKHKNIGMGSDSWSHDLVSQGHGVTWPLNNYISTFSQRPSLFPSMFVPALQAWLATRCPELQRSLYSNSQSPTLKPEMCSDCLAGFPLTMSLHMTFQMSMSHLLEWPVHYTTWVR